MTAPTFRQAIAPAANDNFGAMVAIMAFIWPLPLLVGASQAVLLLLLLSPIVVAPLWAALGARVAFRAGAIWLAMGMGWVVAILVLWGLVTGSFWNDGEWMLGAFLWLVSVLLWGVGFAVGHGIRFFVRRMRRPAAASR